MKNYDWEKSGMLEGLTGSTREIFIKHFNEIDFESLVASVRSITFGASNHYLMVLMK